MKPIQTEDYDHLLKLPGGTDANDLPCRIENGWTHSTWQIAEPERASVLESGSVVVWLWWPNLVGVSLRVGANERVHTDFDMELETGRDAAGEKVTGLVAKLNDDELDDIRAGHPLKLAVDMHPTCPCAIAPVTEEP